MKQFVTPIISYTINKAKRNKFIQNLFEAPFNLEKFDQFGQFKDSFDQEYELLKGLRTKLRPGWENMTKPKKNVAASGEQLSKYKENGIITTSKILPICRTFNKTVENSEILEIGCHSGAASYSLAQFGASKVVGTEFSGYKVESTDQQHITQDKLNGVNEELSMMRSKLKSMFNRSERVEFLDDDICKTTLKPESFDIICSWEVLEHLHDTEAAFRSMYQLLHNGGIIVHEYNPFFCLNGGHSLCTLDFLWGHVRLNEMDFLRYLDEIRPQEKERAASFYKKGLNRMTLHNLHDQLKVSGFKSISILPFVKEQHLRMITRETLEQSQRHYPHLTLQDLTAPRVFVIAKK